MSVELVLIILVLLAGFYMAWNIGANDVANAMGTSVGSGALTLFKAVFIAGILEFCGAFFLGSHVSETMQKEIVKPEFFAQDPKILIYGMLSTLIATAVWLQCASYFRWPVSTTHAIVGALLGFGGIVGGIHAVAWEEVGKITLSWIISPALSALFAFIIFSVLQKNILFAMNPIGATKRWIPIFVFFIFAIFTLSLLFAGVGHIQFDLHSFEVLMIALIVGFLSAAIAMLLVRRIKISAKVSLPSGVLSQQAYSLNKALKHLQRVRLSSKGEKRTAVSSLVKDLESLTESVQEESGSYTRHSDFQTVEKMFAYLQILSASYVAFAHGANDVANAIGPMSAALELIKKGVLTIQTTIPWWLLALGGAGIVVGLATWGWRVIETIGKKITELTPTRGFCAEFGSATTILFASKLGLPISTTHCIVGAVLGVGLARGITALNLKMLRDIVLSWVITLPSSAIVCILTFYLLKAIF